MQDLCNNLLPTFHTGEVAAIMSFAHQKQKYLPWWCKKAAPKLAAASLSLDVEVTFWASFSIFLSMVVDDSCAWALIATWLQLWPRQYVDVQWMCPTMISAPQSYPAPPHKKFRQDKIKLCGI